MVDYPLDDEGKYNDWKKLSEPMKGEIQTEIRKGKLYARYEVWRKEIVKSVEETEKKLNAKEMEETTRAGRLRKIVELKAIMVTVLSMMEEMMNVRLAKLEPKWLKKMLPSQMMNP